MYVLFSIRCNRATFTDFNFQFQLQFCKMTAKLTELLWCWLLYFPVWSDRNINQVLFLTRSLPSVLCSQVIICHSWLVTILKRAGLPSMNLSEGRVERQWHIQQVLQIPTTYVVCMTSRMTHRSFFRFYAPIDRTTWFVCVFQNCDQSLKIYA